MTHEKAETRMLTLSNTTGRCDVGALEVAPQEESWGSKTGPSKYRPSAEQKLCPNFLSLKTNSLSPASAAHMGRNGELSPGMGESYHGHIPKEEYWFPARVYRLPTTPQYGVGPGGHLTVHSGSVIWLMLYTCTQGSEFIHAIAVLCLQGSTSLHWSPSYGTDILSTSPSSLSPEPCWQ